MDLMNSASIDVQKILSDEVDDKAWNHYLKGNRGVFTRRAVRLLGGTEPGRSLPNMRATTSSRMRSITMSTTSRRCSGACWPSATAAE